MTNKNSRDEYLECCADLVKQLDSLLSHAEPAGPLEQVQALADDLWPALQEMDEPSRQQAVHMLVLLAMATLMEKGAEQEQVAILAEFGEAAWHRMLDRHESPDIGEALWKVVEEFNEQVRQLGREAGRLRRSGRRIREVSVGVLGLLLAAGGVFLDLSKVLPPTVSLLPFDVTPQLTFSTVLTSTFAATTALRTLSG